MPLSTRNISNSLLLKYILLDMTKILNQTNVLVSLLKLMRKTIHKYKAFDFIGDISLNCPIDEKSIGLYQKKEKNLLKIIINR